MQYIITTIGKQTYEISEEEYLAIRNNCNDPKMRFILLKGGEMLNVVSISTIMPKEAWLADYRARLRLEGRRLCKYGFVHYLNEPCECRPVPGEATTEEVGISKQLIAQAEHICNPALPIRNGVVSIASAKPVPEIL